MPRFEAISRLNTSSPGFSRPIQLSMPDGAVSATRTPWISCSRQWCDSLGNDSADFTEVKKITVFHAESVPEAPMTGVFMGMPANVTANRFVLIKIIPPSPGIPVRLHTPYAACH